MISQKADLFLPHLMVQAHLIWNVSLIQFNGKNLGQICEK
jgi:hypothetical protein